MAHINRGILHSGPSRPNMRAFNKLCSVGSFCLCGLLGLYSWENRASLGRALLSNASLETRMALLQILKQDSVPHGLAVTSGSAAASARCFGMLRSRPLLAPSTLQGSFIEDLRSAVDRVGLEPAYEARSAKHFSNWLGFATPGDFLQPYGQNK